jgi:hypothetical protein
MHRHSVRHSEELFLEADEVDDRAVRLVPLSAAAGRQPCRTISIQSHAEFKKILDRIEPGMAEKTRI